MRARREAQSHHAVFQKILPFRIEPTIPLHESRLQLGICVNPVRSIAASLPFARFNDPRAYADRALGWCVGVLQIANRYRWNLDVNVDTVLQRA